MLTSARSALSLITIVLASLSGCAAVNPNTTQDVTDFSKSFDWNSDYFEVRSANGKVSIRTFGQDDGNELFEHEITGEVAGAEAADLNQDGYPEVLVFVRGAGSGSYGDVIGYSSNNGKSMTKIEFPPTAENPKINQGYMGHDSFSTAEDTLVQIFPVYRPGDVNANPTGPTRQVQYVLVDGSPTRRLVVARAFEN
jgi:hypothetical protein